MKSDSPSNYQDYPHSDPITITEARSIAYHMHREQKDKSGEKYILHLNAVQKGVALLGGTAEEQIAALFHDAVEDDHTTYEILRGLNVTEDTITMIEAVTKRKGEEQQKYLERIIAAGHGAMRVKLADLIHNTRHDRLAALPKHTADRLRRKYQPSMARLMLELGMIIDTEQQLATKPQGSNGGYWTSSGSTSGKASAWEVKQLFQGDWPKEWPAPILHAVHGDGEVTFTLADGSVRTESTHWGSGSPRKISTYSKHTWTADAKITFTGHDRRQVSEAQIADFMELLEGK